MLTVEEYCKKVTPPMDYINMDLVAKTAKELVDKLETPYAIHQFALLRPYMRECHIPLIGLGHDSLSWEFSAQVACDYVDYRDKEKGIHRKRPNTKKEADEEFKAFYKKLDELSRHNSPDMVRFAVRLEQHHERDNRTTLLDITRERAS